jgi:pilus assembly protein Flp/PilA
MKKMLKNRKGQGFVEYALLVAGVALVGALGVTVLGHKTGELLDSVATTIPGSTPFSNNSIRQGALIEYTPTTGGTNPDIAGTPEGDLLLWLPQINTNDGTRRLDGNLNYTYTAAGNFIWSGALITPPTFVP